MAIVFYHGFANSSYMADPPPTHTRGAYSMHIAGQEKNLCNINRMRIAFLSIA